MNEVIKFLEDNKISYELVEHEEVHTIEDMDKLSLLDKGYVCKNLFLRNANGKIHYLLCCHHSKAIKMDELSKKINSTRLSFASAERLAKHLKLENGYVSPFGILNNEDKKVIVVFDKDLKGQEKVGFHPNTNKATVYLPFSDVENMIKEHGNEILYITL
ncbi:MAG: prolyl-tRNA synthetase associated domain-containing protein [Bacilli bacterium]|nr:prolyl-tRNA synthetase associated domain-containing protein [Bacilli bacterium]